MQEIPATRDVQCLALTLEASQTSMESYFIHLLIYLLANGKNEHSPDKALQVQYIVVSEKFAICLVS